jgi:hypothetical protein
MFSLFPLLLTGLMSGIEQLTKKRPFCQGRTKGFQMYEKKLNFPLA